MWLCELVYSPRFVGSPPRPAGAPGPIALPGAPELLIHALTLLVVLPWGGPAHPTVCVMADLLGAHPTAGGPLASGQPATVWSRGVR